MYSHNSNVKYLIVLQKRMEFLQNFRERFLNGP